MQKGKVGALGVTGRKSRQRVIHRTCLGERHAAPNSARWATFSKRKGEPRLSAKRQHAHVSKWEF